MDRMWDRYFNEDKRTGKSLFDEERKDRIIAVPKQYMSANIIISDIHRDNVLANICISPDLKTEHNIHWWCPAHISVGVTVKELTNTIDEVVVTDLDFNHALAVFTPYIEERTVNIIRVSMMRHISMIVSRGDVREYKNNAIGFESITDTGPVYAK